MPMFRKKPVQVEANRLPESFDDVSDGLRVLSNLHGWTIVHDGVLISTLEGEMLGHWGDWLIRGVKGEYYPCKPDVFEATYEEVSDA